MLKRRIIAAVVLLFGVVVGYGIVRSESPSAPAFLAKHPFSLGLDLSGGSHLLYDADVSAVPSGEINDSMDALRDVIERRVNLLGVTEPTVQVETSTLSGTKQYRLSVELPGITDITKAIEMIGQTPFLEFRTEATDLGKVEVDENGQISIGANELYAPTKLTGKYLKRAQVEFNPSTGEPYVSLQFNEEGAKLFEEITAANIGKTVAIFLDGQPIQTPVVQQAISGGQAVITGDYTPQEAKLLVGRLNSGALPVPITLASTQTIGATLGEEAVEDGVRAALIGFVLISLFLITWYRLPGLVAVLALGMYIVVTLLLYKLIPVTISAAAIAGFIISIGMAVDANILIFERTREERIRGRGSKEAMETGFSRAWFSIRDANMASIMTAGILFWFGTSLIKGFALTLGLGVIVSLLSAITITRIFLSALPIFEGTKIGRILFSSGFIQKK